MTEPWTIEFYQDEQGREPCRTWLDKLSAAKRDSVLAALDVVLAERGLSVVETEYGKPLGDGLYEFRLRWTAAEVRAKAGRVSDAAAAKAERIMLRLFLCTAGRKVILLLSGYDKGRDQSVRRQDREIARARRMMTAHAQANRRDRKNG